MNAAVALLRGLYGQPTYVLLRQLVDVAERLHGQILEMERFPTVERAEQLAIELDGARRHVLQIRQAMQNEAIGGSPLK